MRGNPVKGAGYLLRGFSMLPEPGIRQFVLIPMLINILIFSGAIWLLVNEFEGWVNYWLGQLPQWMSFLDWLLWPLFAVLVLITVYYGFSMVANLIAAPFNGFLSEKVEKMRSGAVMADEGWKGMLATVPRALQRELSKVAYYLPRLLLLLIISFIPVVNVIAPFLWFLFGAWMMAIQYCDYPMDNNKVSFRQMKVMLAERRLTSLSFGALVQVGMMIPLVNLIMMPAAVIGATLFWCEEHCAKQKVGH
ncbi:sulfate transporter CysZ [Neptunomonas japonica]|uniref:Sulfate transporter CysZ n=1 Tax=Neptunomonas japonica JAMM 1380 TaxID=1441457 RepID=A0A7R6PK09_9GAMM|nr:sulfate transporter CysZ [Neptunomonas japonica]BBB31597.1 cysteine biosynthesis protein CysZ [Neptunomonas japonica JAMM 1380]